MLSSHLLIAIVVSVSPSMVTDPSTWTPGQVLAERSADLGCGFREVHQSVVMPADWWEGVGHFGFTYSRDEVLCQCAPFEVMRSADGRFAIYVDTASGQLVLFDAAGSDRTYLTYDYIGTPVTATWDLSGGSAIVRLEQHLEEDHVVTEELPVLLPPSPNRSRRNVDRE
jgi:hypothetical protein